MTVVTPVYQEDPELFRAAVVSWLANDIEEVICVIDYTDKRSIEIARELGTTVIVTDIPGKRDALRRGWEAASTSLSHWSTPTPCGPPTSRSKAPCPSSTHRSAPSPPART